MKSDGSTVPTFLGEKKKSQYFKPKKVNTPVNNAHAKLNDTSGLLKLVEQFQSRFRVDKIQQIQAG